MNIGDLFLQLLADGSKLTKSVTDSAGKAGDAGAKTMNQRLSVGLKTGAVTAFGAAAAGAFTIATKGALELDNVQANFQAQTGVSAEAASHAADVINKAAGDNVLSLNEVSEAAIRVHNDLGLTGKAADEMTSAFARFARVTKQDAGEAVSKFDDILDNWGLTAADAQTIMDKLIVSHQKYGGAIGDNEVTLAKLAPAMKAANFQIDDGIALLGLFGAKGLDSERAAAAFSKALTKVKSPAELKALIKDIQDTKDPFARATKAANLFGAKAGAQLANALGGANLDDYKVSVEEAAGATEKAAAAIDNSFSGKVQKAISQANAALRGFGKDLGPAVTAFAATASLLAPVFKALGANLGKQLGSGLVGSKAIATAIGTALDEAPGSGVVKGALAKLGAFMGTTLGKAIGVGIALGIADQAGRAGVGAATGFLSDQVTEAVAKGDEQSLKNLKEAKQALEDRANSIIGLPFKIVDIGGVKAGWEKSISDLDAGIAAIEAKNASGQPGSAAHLGTTISEGVIKTLTDGIKGGTPEVTDAVHGMTGAASRAMEGMQNNAKVAGTKVPEGFAAGVLARQGKVVDAFNELKNLMQNALGRQGRIARDIGMLTSKELQAGLHDRRGAVRAEAASVQGDIETELARLVLQGGRVGKKAMDELKKSLKSKNPDVRAAAQRVQQIVDTALQGTVKPAGQAGTAAGNAYARNLTSAVTRALVLARGTVAAAKHDEGHRAGGGPVRAGHPYWVNEATGRSEMMVPSMGGYVLTHADAVSALAGGGGGGDTFQITVPVTGVLRAETPADIARPMREIVRTGIVRSRRSRSRVEVPTRG